MENVKSHTQMPDETRLRPKSATERNADFTTSKEQIQENQEFRQKKPRKPSQTKRPKLPD